MLLPIGAGDRSSSSCAVARMGGDSQSSMTPGDVGPYTLPVVVSFVSSSPTLSYIYASVCVCVSFDIYVYILTAHLTALLAEDGGVNEGVARYAYIYTSRDVQVPPPHTHLFFL